MANYSKKELAILCYHNAAFPQAFEIIFKNYPDEWNIQMVAMSRVQIPRNRSYQNGYWIKWSLRVPTR